MSKQKIYNLLRKAGMTEAGALGVLGNWECESNLEPGRVQGDFSPFRTVSKTYVQSVTNGSISREAFSSDGRGFGLYQLTFWKRKQGYWDFWKSSGKPLDSAELQTQYALFELEQDYPSLLQFLKTTNDVFTATSRVCREFERPAVNNIDARFQAANSLKYEINLDENPEKTEEQNQKDPDLVLSDLQINSTGDVVVLLQAALNVRGYNCGSADGIFGAKTQSALNSFKRDKGMKTDGKADALTWAELLKVGG